MVAKAVIPAYYGSPARYSYFVGCSAGGRGALNAAAKFPDHYDGVLAGAPTRNMPGLLAGWAVASQQTAPSPAKLASLYRAQLAACDARDGLADGVIGDPGTRSFDPATIRCPDGADAESCLTNPEIEAVDAIRSDLTRAGRTVYSRLGLGNPAEGFGVFMPLGPAGSPTVSSFLSASFLPYIVFGDPTYDPAGYDVERDLQTVVDRLAEASGRHIANARLYTPPGVGHCGGGPGADGFDLLTALAEWVENGRAPRTPTAWKLDAAGQVLFSRPLCEHPRYPRYLGHGDPDDARSFRCARPE